MEHSITPGLENNIKKIETGKIITMYFYKGVEK